MIKPTRVQLSRKRGWRMPDNTVKVDRTTRWGNPYDLREFGEELSLRLFEHTARGCWSPANVCDVDEPTVALIHALHCRWVRRVGASPQETARAELRGRHLGCWCAPGDGCHADVLLIIANA